MGTVVGWGKDAYNEGKNLLSEGYDELKKVPIIGGALNTVEGAFTPADPAGLQQAAGDARANSQQFMGDYLNRQQGVSPQMQAAQMQAASAQAANPFAAAQMNAAQIDPSQQAEFRQGQMGLAQQLQDQIAGKAPSVAQMQQQQAFDRLSAQQAGLAAQMGRGGNQALAMRTAMQNQAQLGGQAAQQGAILRAQEIQANQNALQNLYGMGRGQDIGLAGQQAGLTQGANQLNAQLNQQAGLQNQANQQGVNLANAQFQQGAGQLNAQNQQAANAANQQAGLTTRQQDINQQLGLGGLVNSATGNQTAAQNAAFQGRNQQQQTQANIVSSAAGAASTLSDERAKTDIAPEHSEAFSAFLEKLRPASFRYQGSSEPKVGVMAQDVEKSPVGRTLVRQGADGFKRLDVNQSVGTMMAAMAHMHRRLKRLEGEEGE